MSNLTEVIYLRPASDNGWAERSPIDTGVRSDLNITLDDDVAELWHLAKSQFRVRCVTESIGSDDRVIMYRDAIHDPRVVSYRDAAEEGDVISKGYILVESGVAMDRDVLPNGATGADRNESADRRPFAD